MLAGMNQLWRRNIRKADKAGVAVATGSAARTSRRSTTSTSHTAERDHFTPRPLAYFETMYDALGAEDPDRITLWLAHHEGDLVGGHDLRSASAGTRGTPTAPPPPTSATSAAPTPCSGR